MPSLLTFPSSRTSQAQIGPNGPTIVGPSVNWKQVTQSLNNIYVGKILFVMDCCFAAELATYDGPELLAASGWSSQATASAPNSLTQILINELKQRNGDAATVAEIYSSMHRNAYTTNLWSPIVHIPQLGSSSVVLEKLGTKRRKPESLPARQAAVRHLAPSQFRVLISVNLQNDVKPPVLEQWKTWLTSNLPSGLLSADVRIESAFPTGSSLLLVTVPVELWTMLPVHELAYGFVGFVKGNNVFPTFEPAVLGLRPRGGENIPPSHNRGQSEDLGRGKRR